MNNFLPEFDAALPDFERAFGEPWSLAGVEYPAIDIEDLTYGDRAIGGGRLLDVTTVIHIRKDVATQSGVAKGSLIQARGKTLRVGDITDAGDASLDLQCGPAGVETPRR